MVGLLVIIVVSGVLLYVIEKKNITILGIIPNQKNMIQFLIGFLCIVIINLSLIYIETLLKSVSWELKPINYGLIFKAFVYHLKSALTEDLIFRGALLYILISKIGNKKAILVSAIFFGIYHIFSYGMIGGRIVPIVYVILVTGFTGYVWAYIFDKTKSIMMPLGFHIGSNMVMACFFPSQPYGELLFTELSRVNFTEWNELYYSLFRGLYPSIMTLIFVKLVLKWNNIPFNKKMKLK